MRLTKKKAIKISIELWAWLAETGKEYKGDWPKWGEYGKMAHECPLCEYARKKWADEDCHRCPYRQRYCRCITLSDHYSTPFGRWSEARTKPKRKKFAKEFLEQLKTL